MPARLPIFSGLCACLLLCTIGAAAQAYEPGLLVRANGDTLRGEIENGFWKDPPAFIRFRPVPTQPGEIYKPRQLKAVRFTPGRYFRYEALPLDHAAETRRDRLPQGLHPNVHIDSLLAEVLIEGPATMLRVVRFSTTHYLLRRPGLPVLDLCEREYLTPTAKGGLVITNGNNYRGQLSVFFGDCPAAEQAARRATFSAAGLATVVQAYNESCAPAAPPARTWLAQAAPRRPVTWLWGVTGGVRAVFANTSGRVLAQSVPNNFPKQLQPFAGLYGEMLLPNRTLAAYGELSLSRYQGQGSTLAYYEKTPYILQGTTYYYDAPVYSTFSYRAWLVTAHVGLRYYLPLPHEQQFLIGGGLDLSQRLVDNITITSGPAATPRSSDLSYPSFVPLPSLGMGWRNQRLTIALDAQVVSGLGLRLGAAYRLGRNADVMPAKRP